jgi:L,D-peptidoglycan transpeptidase YkuD (ErfK/YbiS/YcfS/YnhG family)
MRTFVKLSSLVAIILIGSTINVSAQARKKADNDTQVWRYDIEGVGVGTQGSYLIKVWTYSKNPKAALEQSKKNAVHGVVFKGFIGKQGISGQKALAGNPNLEQEKEEFFKEFFADNGKYMKFVSLASDGSVAAEDRMKVGKEYKIGVVVSVNVGALRKDLEEAGVIKKLGSGF